MTDHFVAADDGQLVALHVAPVKLQAAIRYLQRCQASHGIAVLTADTPAPIGMAIAHFLEGRMDALRVARIPAATASSHAFLEMIFTQLGFEPLDSTTDDLLRLLTVIVRQGSDQPALCIVMDDSRSFGPRIFETLRELALNCQDAPRPPMFVLGGDAALLRVLDSPAMTALALLTRERFDFDAASDPCAADELADARAQLILTLNQATIRHYPTDAKRMLIGRGPHCDICIPSRFISRQHALLVHKPDGDWLIDLKSTNGTSINSRLIEQQRLDDGDVISIGNHRLFYRNPLSRWRNYGTAATPDQLSETMVMRSIQPLLEIEPLPSGTTRSPNAA
jgi:hypothetical protein